MPLGGWSHDPLSMLDQKEQLLTFVPETWDCHRRENKARLQFDLNRSLREI